MISKKNILFGKFGQKIIFNRNSKEAARSNTNGNYEAYNMLKFLLNEFSEDVENVFVASDNIEISFEEQKKIKNLKAIVDFLPKIDYAFILLGANENEVSEKLLEAINSGIKWFAIITDPRCLSQPFFKRIKNPPLEVYAGVENEIVEFAGKEFATKYLNVEIMNIYGESIEKKVYHKHNKLIIVANETQTWDRIGHVKEMISLIGNDDVIIYGRYKNVENDKRFAGEKEVQHIYNSQKLCKITYIAPISPGWITAKYLECIHRGIIPLMSTSYASSIPMFQKGIKDIEQKLIVETKEDVKEMFDKVTNDFSYYYDTLWKLRSFVSNNYSKHILKSKIISSIK